MTFHQLEVFWVVCHEKSYANAALELNTTRPNIKRTCEEFEKLVGRKLFEENTDRTLQPTEFALGLCNQVGPLSRSLRRLSDGVKVQHQAGRILKFGAAGEFFRGGLFTEFLSRLKISDSFRPCFLRIEAKRHRNALLNAECDVYFGAGLIESARMELLELGNIPWKIIPGKTYKGPLPTHPADLVTGKWWITVAGETEAATALLNKFRAAGAIGGAILADDTDDPTNRDGVIFAPDTTARHTNALDPVWPTYRFAAVIRKHHPYSELKARLQGAASL